MWYEFGSADHPPRIPEPECVMGTAEQVEAFHAMGEPGNLFEPLYLFNALAISRITPQGGSVLDLGCGSCQFAACLAELRPDLHITAWDLSPKMLEEGAANLARRGIAGRVDLRLHDMLALEGDEQFDTLYSIFSLHHLPSSDAVSDLMLRMPRVASRHQASLWIFDHVRPRSSRTIEQFPHLLSPDASPYLKQDSANSLRASLTFAELEANVRLAWGPDAGSAKGSWLGAWFYQIHYLISHRHAHELASGALSREVRKNLRLLKSSFPRSWVNP
jgi:SAM-dependent methyltransferase